MGTDTHVYGIQSFYNCVNNSLEGYYFHSENNIWSPLCKIYFWSIANLFRTQYWYFFFIETAIIVPVIISLVKQFNSDYAIGVFVFTAIFYPESFNLMRQMISMGFVLLSYTELRDKSVVRSIILLLMAIGFHNSAVICLSIYPISYYLVESGKSYLRKFAILVLAFIILRVAAFPILNYLSENLHFYSNYIHGANVIGIGGRAYLFFSAAFTILLVMLGFGYMNGMNDAGDGPFRDNFTIVSAICVLGLVLQTLLFASGNLYRVGFYFLYYIILLAPLVVSAARLRIEKQILTCLIIAVAMCWATYVFGIQHRCEVVPYLAQNTYNFLMR